MTRGKGAFLGWLLERKDSCSISCLPSWRELFEGAFIVYSSSASIGVLFYFVFSDSQMMIVYWG